MMLHTFVGNFGHLCVIIAFVTALVSAYSYYRAALFATDGKQWQIFARVAFGLHGLAVFGIVAALFTIIYRHYYEYHYAWSHSSNNLPTHYMISCFWEGQEGSFLLWIFWHVLLGAILIISAKKWESSVMMIFALVQAFLVSMILGIAFFDIKIGSSPFILLRDALAAPIFETKPDFVPADGTGLNPLLQNYWMVIHPPTLFLGFALCLVPFAFCVAGLYTRQFREWVQPALAWAHSAALILGVGIMMGAYWAYETLNFGGYWNWDPVENAVFIPWLVLVASIHVLMIFRKNDAALRTAMILVMTTFILVLYATFLTRSGVLGNASVHSFTDLGLSGQLLMYLLVFLVLGVGLLAWRWKEIPASEKELSAYHHEFWIFAGATVLCMSAFQVLIPTSIPVLNAFLGFVGVKSNLAPPADAVHFYTKFQLWFGAAIALLSGTGQFFFWNKIDKENLKNAFTTPLIITLLLASLVITLAKIYQPQYIVLLTLSLYSIIANLLIFKRIAQNKVKLSGGALTHIGIALMLVGILFSAGYSKVVSLNFSGKVYNTEFPEEMNKENLLLFRNQPKQMLDYVLTYKGPRMESEQVEGYIDKEILMPTANPYRMIVKENIVQNGNTYAKKGDTIQVYNENTYYEIEYQKPDGQVFTLYPRVQDNPQMGAVPSPDISSYLTADLYTHVTNLAVDDQEATWSAPETHQIGIGDTIFLNDYVAILDGVSKENQVVGVEMGAEDFAVRAHLRVLGLNMHYDLQPIYLIKDKSAGLIAAINRDLGLKVQLEKIEPQAGKFTFTVSTTQKDWVIIKAIEMPFINLLWAGTLLMAIGFGVAAYRRFAEVK